MSNEIEAIKDPGLPAHVHRKADADPKAAKRAERQVATMFLVSALGTVLLYWTRRDPLGKDFDARYRSYCRAT